MAVPRAIPYTVITFVQCPLYAGRYGEPNDVRSLSDTFNIHRTLPIDNNSAR
jgi:hypothetical protein